jgi:hypothetical protein
VLAGLAVSVSALSLLPEGIRPLRPDEGLPPLPEFGILLLKSGGRLPVAEALAAHIEDSFRNEMAAAQPMTAA